MNMTTSLFSPAISERIAKAVAECVAHLEVPGEALLASALADMRQQCEERRRAVQHELAQVQADIEAALARILLSADDLKNLPDPEYLKRS